MSLDQRAGDILSRGWHGEHLEPEECIYLLSFREKSPVANLSVSLADRLIHSQSGGVGRITASIDVSTGPCPRACGFCRWSESVCMERFSYMEDSDLSALCERAGMYSDVTEIRLSAIDGTPAEDLVHFVSVASSSARKGTVISIDFADLDLDVCRDLRKAGASVAYHSCRIGEGVDTDIKPERRMETVRNLCDAGFRVVAGTEPVGPEHSAKEIVDCFFSTLGTDVKHAEINPREAVPDTRLGDRGTISSARLAQIRGVLTLASAWNSQSAAGTGLAEPYIQGKNVAVAHYDMKDWRAQTEAARRRLFNAGFDRILRTDGSAASLSIAYLRQTGAL